MNTEEALKFARLIVMILSMFGIAIGRSHSTFLESLGDDEELPSATRDLTGDDHSAFTPGSEPGLIPDTDQVTPRGNT